MHADPAGVLTGSHFLDGDHACCEGALAAGARFSAGYPITPSTEVVERFAARVPTVGGTFIQMEDELAASIAIQGAVWGGAKAFTVTSGPGFSLMMEHIGYAAMTETPCVFVDVQRGGPSTGLPTLPAQADMMQVRWGSHGDYEIIALCPNSPQECFDLTITAFNYGRAVSLPGLRHDGRSGGHMTEKVVIPPPEQIEVTPRRYTTIPPGEFNAYEPREDLVPDMPHVGEGYNVHVTGLTHDERGYPNMTPDVQDKLVHRLQDKILKNADKIMPVRRSADRRLRCRRDFLRNHLARRPARHRDGPRQGRKGRQVPPHHRLAFPRAEDQGDRRANQRHRGRRTEPRTDGARSRARRGR